MSVAVALLAAATACALPPGWQSVDAPAKRYVVFGETHGTREAPALVGSTVCALARQKKRVLLAVELDSTENDALQQAWRVKPKDFLQTVRRLMPSTVHREDGVASAAMIDMLASFHRLHARGYAVDVVAFNGARDEAQRKRHAHLPGQGPHEAAQAENINDAARRGNYDKVVVLVGSLHARKRPVERQEVTFESMAMRLAPPAKVVSLRMVAGSGTSWNCQLKPEIKLAPGQPITSDLLECGPYGDRSGTTMTGRPRLGLGKPAGGPSEDWAAYDGWFWVGPVHASPPAFRKER